MNLGLNLYYTPAFSRDYASSLYCTDAHTYVAVYHHSARRYGRPNSPSERFSLFFSVTMDHPWSVSNNKKKSSFVRTNID